jgi:hypothetical protein
MPRSVLGQHHRQGQGPEAGLGETLRVILIFAILKWFRRKAQQAELPPPASEIEMNPQAGRSEATAIVWSRDPEFSSASHAEHARVGPYELVAFDLPATDREPWIIGWELFGGRDLQTLLNKGCAATFEDAKTKAEAALKKQLSQPDPH